MNRRQFINSTTVAAAGTLAGSTLLAQSSKHDHSKMKASKRPSAKPEALALLEKAEECLSAGRACISHCMYELSQGNTKMAECHASVMNMVSHVNSTAEIVNYRTAKSAALKQMLLSCAAFCEECEKSCKPHIGHHRECENCAKACLECAKACKKLASVI